MLWNVSIAYIRNLYTQKVDDKELFLPPSCLNLLYVPYVGSYGMAAMCIPRFVNIVVHNPARLRATDIITYTPIYDIHPGSEIKNEKEAS